MGEVVGRREELGEGREVEIQNMGLLSIVEEKCRGNDGGAFYGGVWKGEVLGVVGGMIAGGCEGRGVGEGGEGGHYLCSN